MSLLLRGVGAKQRRLRIASADLETGDTAQFNSITESGGGSLAVTAAAARAGAYGLEHILTLGTAGDEAYGTLTFDAQTSISYGLQLDPNSLTMTDSDQFVAADLLGDAVGGATQRLRVDFRISDGNYQIRLVVTNDVGANTTVVNFTNIADDWHNIRIEWRAASATGADDGYAALYLDGASLGSSSVLDTDQQNATSARVGAISQIDAGTGGTFYVDEIEVFDS